MKPPSRRATAPAKLHTGTPLVRPLRSLGWPAASKMRQASPPPRAHAVPSVHTNSVSPPVPIASRGCLRAAPVPGARDRVGLGLNAAVRYAHEIDRRRTATIRSGARRDAAQQQGREGDREPARFHALIISPPTPGDGAVITRFAARYILRERCCDESRRCCLRSPSPARRLRSSCATSRAHRARRRPTRTPAQAAMRPTSPRATTRPIRPRRCRCARTPATTPTICRRRPVSNRRAKASSPRRSRLPPYSLAASLGHRCARKPRFGRDGSVRRLREPIASSRSESKSCSIARLQPSRTARVVIRSH